MKKQRFTSLVCLLISLGVALLLTSCETVEDQCESLPMDSCEAEFTVCVSDGESYVEYNEEKYYCEGNGESACDQAINSVIVASGCTAKSVALDIIVLKERTLSLMDQLRASVHY